VTAEAACIVKPSQFSTILGTVPECSAFATPKRRMDGGGLFVD
jgi:hypothetical protein